MDEKIEVDDIIKFMNNITIDDLLKNINKSTDNVILDDLKNFSGNDETKIMIESIIKSFKIFLELIEREYFVEAFGILRSIFESILMCTVLNDKSIYDVFIKLNQSEEESSNVQQNVIRKKAINFFRRKMKLKGINWYQELNDYYDELCMLVHPTLLKNYFYKISNSQYDKDNIKIMIRVKGLYCKYLLLLFLKYQIGERDCQKYYDLYTVHQLIEISTIAEENDIDKIFEENKKYLHLEINTENVPYNAKEKMDYIECIINKDIPFDFDKFKEGLKYMYFIVYMSCFENKNITL